MVKVFNNELSLHQNGKPGDCDSNMLESEKKVRTHQAVFMHLNYFTVDVIFTGKLEP